MGLASSPSNGKLRRPARMLCGLVLGLLGLAMLLLLLLPYVISLDGVKAQLVAQVEAALQRRVEVGAVRLQILSGLGAGLEDLTIFNPPGWQQPHLVNVGTLSVKLAWRPLLQRRLEITRLVLSDGDIVIERDAQGRLNVDDFLEPRPDGATTPSPSVSRPAPSTPRAPVTQPGEAALSGFMASHVALREMQVTFVDHLAVPGQPVMTSVRNVRLDLREVAFDTPIPFDLSGTLLTDGAHNIRLRGQIGPLPASMTAASIPIDIHLQATDVLLSQLTPYLGAAFPLTHGRIGATAKILGHWGKHLRVSGDLTLAEAILSEALADIAVQPLPTLTSTYEVGLDLTQELMQISEAHLTFAQLRAAVQGEISRLTTSPHLNLSLRTHPFSPGALLAAMPVLASRFPTPLDLHGTAQLQAALQGTLRHLRSETQVDLRDILVKSGSFGGGAQESGGLLLETDHTQALVAMALVESQSPKVEMDVRTQRLVFDQRSAGTPRTPAQAPTPGPPPGPPPTPRQPSPAPPAVELSGKIGVAEGRVSRLAFQQMTADISLVEGVLTSAHQMHVYAGTYQGTVHMDLRQHEPTYTLDARLLNLDVGQAMHELTPAKNLLFGVLNSDLRLAGRGLTWELISKSLSGDGRVHVREAKLTTVDLVPKLVHMLHTLGGVVGLAIANDLHHEAFRVVEADWHLREGKLFTDALRLRGQGMEALLDGYLGLDHSVAYAGQVFLPGALVGIHGRALPRLQDEKGRLVLPFTVKGTVTAPQIVFDEQSLVRLTREALTDKLRQQIEEKFGGAVGQLPAAETPGQESGKSEPEPGAHQPLRQLPRKILEDLLRR